MKKLKYLSVILILTLLISCAYFNMFYNGRKHFRAAEKGYVRSGDANRNGYNESIKELSKILEFYPESEWVDDALLLIGRSYYRLNKYDKARRKFQELITNYPDSELLTKAKLWLAEVEISDKKADVANELISQIDKNDESIDEYEIKKLSADLALSLKDSADALNYYLETSNLVEETELKITLYLKTAELAKALGNYSTAADIYQELTEIAENRAKTFDYLLSYGEMVEMQGYSDSAIVIYNDLIEKEIYDSYSHRAKIALVKLYLNKKNYDLMYETVDEILRTTGGVAGNDTIFGAASYFAGEYYLKHEKNIEKAKTYYDTVRQFIRTGEYKELADNRSRNIFDYNQYKTFIYNYSFEKDSLENLLEINKNNIETYITQNDSVALKKEKSLLKDNRKAIKSLNKNYVITNIKLAELFLYDFSYQDSAKNYYENSALLKAYPHYAARAMLSLAHIESENQDSIFTELLNKYPDTKAANYIREIKGLEKVQVIEDTASFYYNIASDYIDKDEYQEAYDYYLKVIDEFPEADITPRVLLSAAYVQEEHIKDKEKAKELYEQLKESYPSTEQARFAALKLRKPDEEIKVEDIKPVEKKEDEKLHEYDMWQLMDRRNP